MSKFIKSNNNLGLFLAIGESLTDLQNKGQLKRLLDYNIKSYANSFKHVYIFSYKREIIKLPKNCTLIANEYNINRFIYALTLPLIKAKVIKNCDIFRGLQITGGIPAVLSKILYSKKYLVNYGYDYSSFAKMEGKYLQSVLFYFIKYPLLKLSDGVIVTTKELQNYISGHVPKRKIHLIPNGVDIKLFCYKKRKSSDILSIIYLGRLEKQKNLINLIYACKNLSYPYKLTYYGSGSQKKELLKYANKNKVKLQINPPVDYMQVPNILSKADIFVLPSYEEGNPKILLEAMSTGLAVLGSKVKGIKEIINDGVNGLICGTQSFEITNSLNKLNDYKYRNSLGLNARKYIENNYNIKTLLKREVEILKEL